MLLKRTKDVHHSTAAEQSYCSNGPVVSTNFNDQTFYDFPAQNNRLELPQCFACRTSIFDRYYLLAADRLWHINCLQCCVCGLKLETELSCYYRAGLIFCKTDYYKQFSKRCTLCGQIIPADQMVMRAKDRAFHLQCFRCAICSCPLEPGQIFGLSAHGSLLYCQRHCSLDPWDGDPSPLPSSNHDDALKLPLDQEPKTGGKKSRDAVTTEGGCYVSDDRTLERLDGRSSEVDDGSMTEKNCDGQMATGKGRPKKRRTTELREREDSFSESLRQGRSPVLDVAMCQSPASTTNSHQQLMLNARSKRMRTSFKHNQLRTMKNYFILNHNPDAKDLKQLAQKTGLTKRVLQVTSLKLTLASSRPNKQHLLGNGGKVWFQNARAKHRRATYCKQQQQLHVSSISCESADSIKNGMAEGSGSEKGVRSPRMNPTIPTVSECGSVLSFSTHLDDSSENCSTVDDRKSCRGIKDYCSFDPVCTGADKQPNLRRFCNDADDDLASHVTGVESPGEVTSFTYYATPPQPVYCGTAQVPGFGSSPEEGEDPLERGGIGEQLEKVTREPAGMSNFFKTCSQQRHTVL